MIFFPLMTDFQERILQSIPLKPYVKTIIYLKYLLLTNRMDYQAFSILQHFHTSRGSNKYDYNK